MASSPCLVRCWRSKRLSSSLPTAVLQKSCTGQAEMLGFKFRGWWLFFFGPRIVPTMEGALSSGSIPSPNDHKNALLPC